MMLAISFSISAETENHAMGGCQDGQMMGMMQMHVEMMRFLMDSDGMDQAKMKEMMENPQMMEMMKIHMMNMQMMNGGMMGEHSSEDSEEHVH
jgi:hypothetical protein